MDRRRYKYYSVFTCLTNLIEVMNSVFTCNDVQFVYFTDKMNELMKYEVSLDSCQNHH